MDKRWVDGDSARKMTIKYNSVAEDVKQLVETSGEVNEATAAELLKINQELGKKIESVSAEDVGLEKADNTSDMDKPVSKLQARAIDLAVEDKITSVPTSQADGETGFIASIHVSGTTLVIGK